MLKVTTAAMAHYKGLKDDLMKRRREKIEDRGGTLLFDTWMQCEMPISKVTMKVKNEEKVITKPMYKKLK